MTLPMLSVGDAVLKSAAYLEGKGVDSPRLDAEVLLCAVLNCDRLRLYMDWKKPLTELELSGYREFLRRRGVDREPVCHIIGRREFYSRKFRVTRDTFSPRPETEGLVERALMLLRSEDALSSRTTTVFEIGTGTGCIIVTMAAESDAHEFIASEVSPAALEVARQNAQTHGVAGRVHFRQGANFAGYRGSLGLIVSNPPYIRSGDIAGLSPEVRVHDPMAALDGGEDGLDVVRIIVAEAPRLLIPGGWVALELGEEQGADATRLFRRQGAYDRVAIEKDTNGLDRYLLARRNLDDGATAVAEESHAADLGSPESCLDEWTGGTRSCGEMAPRPEGM